LRSCTCLTRSYRLEGVVRLPFLFPFPYLPHFIRDLCVFAEKGTDEILKYLCLYVMHIYVKKSEEILQKCAFLPAKEIKKSGRISRRICIELTKLYKHDREERTEIPSWPYFLERFIWRLQFAFYSIYLRIRDERALSLVKPCLSEISSCERVVHHDR